MASMTGRQPRADAVRNRANIVGAARSLIAVRGVEVGMDDIAREAGVAVGTVYRHFPSKAELITAIVQERVDRVLADLAGAKARLASGGSAREEIVALFTSLAGMVGEDRALKVAAGDLVAQAMSKVDRRVMRELDEIVAAGHRQGSLHPDVTAEDLALMLSLLPGDETPEPGRRRWLQLVLRSLLG
jgi:AcrR family transcriptional regulator